ncbi:uncharacterized protein DFL_000381 [Arthrobotrys flagrans]|uniref:BTB domain-containing protein n=1 Tax=Arthrobotrys flagrans TaxID=97331 RepID=A0A437ADK5_ARTFL|nr:hypothetical protein DFL_000381 [Arthrobotrys flagrans]
MTPHPPPKKQRITLFHLTVLIGPSLTPFHLHQSIVLPKSPMLASYTRATTLHATIFTKPINLSELSPFAFRIIISYLYNGATSLASLKTAEEILNAYEAADYLLVKDMKTDILSYITTTITSDSKKMKEVDGLVGVLEAWLKYNPGAEGWFEKEGEGWGGYGDDGDGEEMAGRELYEKVWEEGLKRWEEGLVTVGPELEEGESDDQRFL